MLQQENAEDFVLATGKTNTVRHFCELAFLEVGIKIEWKGEGDSEGDAEDGDGDSDDSSGGDGGGASSANAKTTGLRAAGVAPFAPISKPILSFEAAEILDQALAPEIEQRMEKYLKP